MLHTCSGESTGDEMKAYLILEDGTVFEGTQIGALALGEGAVSKVGPDVSGLHARLWCDDAGRWWVEGLGSRNGTVLVSGLTGEETTVEPPAAERREWQAAPVEVAPGDQLRLGESTTFVLIEGLPG